MNLSTKKLSFILIAASVVFAGCTKKPKRPDPTATMIGPEGGLANTPLGFNDPLAPGLGLEPRLDSNNINEGQVRGLLEPVYFDFDQSGIKGTERVKLDAAKAYLDANPGDRLLLEGHCDWKGTAEYNLGLGDRRASSAKQYLTTTGVSDDRIEVLSKGDLEAVENADASTQARDRRVELVVLKP